MWTPSHHPSSFVGEKKPHPNLSDPHSPDLQQKGAEQTQTSLICPKMSLNLSNVFEGGLSLSVISLQQQRLQEALEEVVPSRNTSLWMIWFVKWLCLPLCPLGFNTPLEYAPVLGWEGAGKRNHINNALRHPYQPSGCAQFAYAPSCKKTLCTAVLHLAEITL